ncbi:unnamed protein product [Linum trigynum]|uniref:Uncharacterized protein n=1 Tax=Linum trigynum TaxID=586398 RepID=A0AAV2DQD9_9ROSI
MQNKQAENLTSSAVAVASINIGVDLLVAVVRTIIGSTAAAAVHFFLSPRRFQKKRGGDREIENERGGRWKKQRGFSLPFF